MQDINDNIILNLHVTPEKPVVSYLTPLTGCVSQSQGEPHNIPKNGIWTSFSFPQSGILDLHKPEHMYTAG